MHIPESYFLWSQLVRASYIASSYGAMRYTPHHTILVCYSPLCVSMIHIVSLSMLRSYSYAYLQYIYPFVVTFSLVAWNTHQWWVFQATNANSSQGDFHWASVSQSPYINMTQCHKVHICSCDHWPACADVSQIHVSAVSHLGACVTTCCDAIVKRIDVSCRVHI